MPGATNVCGARMHAAVVSHAIHVCCALQELLLCEHTHTRSCNCFHLPQMHTRADARDYLRSLSTTLFLPSYSLEYRCVGTVERSFAHSETVQTYSISYLPCGSTPFASHTHMRARCLVERSRHCRYKHIHINRGTGVFLILAVSCLRRHTQYLVRSYHYNTLLS